MLDFDLTPHQTGMALWGDHATLERLHRFIHRVVEESPVIEDKEGFVLGLAYDVRKAFERQRHERWRGPTGDRNRCRIYGVEILWPLLLIQTGMLRHAIGFMSSDKLDQAIIYELEHVVESALRAAAPSTAEAILHATRRACTATYSHLDAVLEGRCVYFIELPASERLVMLAKVMDTLDPMYEFLAKNGAGVRLGIIPPGAFRDCDKDWPEFEW